MGNFAANLSDFLLNKANEFGLIPTNAATLLRSISAKQLGDGSFRPRPITVANFSNAELDAIYRLLHTPAGKPRKQVSYDNYSSIAAKRPFSDNTVGGTSAGYNIITTLGSFTSDGKNIHDTYDFDKSPITLFREPDGTVTAPTADALLDGTDERQVVVNPGENEREQIRNYLREISPRNNSSPYDRIRQNAHRLAHAGDDPDDAKIKLNLSIDDIRRRLGRRLGTYDVNQNMSRLSVVGRGAALGGIVGTTAGAATGLAGGLLSLLSERRRRRWLQTLAKSTAVGAGVGGVIGVVGGGIGAGTTAGLIKHSESVSYRDGSREQRKRRWMYRLLPYLAYGLPVMTVAGAGLYGAAKARRLGQELLREFDPADVYKPIIVDVDRMT